MVRSVGQFAKDVLRKVHPEGRVCYFLGAGFSAAHPLRTPEGREFRLPVSSGFLSKDCVVFLVDGLRTPCVTELANAYPDLERLLDRLVERYGELEPLDLEAVLTDIYNRAIGLGAAWEFIDQVHTSHLPDLDDPTGTRLLSAGEDAHEIGFHSLQADYQALMKYITVRLRVVDAADGAPEGIVRLLKLTKRRDSIITLNYDNLVERTHNTKRKSLYDSRFERMHAHIGATTPSYLSGPALFSSYTVKNDGVFAKLHGSVDWYACSSPSCPNHRLIERPWQYDSSLPQTLDAVRCTLCASPPESVIIPPIAAKPFERFPKLRLMWLQAFEALASAQRWTFIGVSFAQTDFLLASLLRAASEKSLYLGASPREVGHICVVNESHCAAEESAKRLRGYLSPAMQQVAKERPAAITLFASLNDYLTQAEEADADRA